MTKRREKESSSRNVTAASPSRGNRFVAIAALIAVMVIGGAYWAFSRPNSSGPLKLPAGPVSADTPHVAAADFLGSESCAQCHADQYAAWKGSTHGHAGGPPTPDRVIAPFDGVAMRFKDATVIPSRNGAEYRFTVNQNGRPAQVFRVDQVVGGGFMAGGGTQAFFSKFPDG